MAGLVREEECFVLNLGLDRQPVEVDEGGGDVLPGLGAGEKPGSRVLDVLEPLQGFAGNPGQYSIAIPRDSQVFLFLHHISPISVVIKFLTHSK